VKTIAIIPARYESSRLPGKPLKKINNKPMIQHVFERVSDTNNLDGVFIATDDIRIKQAATDFGGQVLMTSSQARSGTDRIAEAADILQLAKNDLIVNIQGDQPLIQAESIEAVIAPFTASNYQGQFEMSTLSFKIIDQQEITNPKDIKLVTDINGMALYFSRATIPYDRNSQQHDFYKHLGVYAYTRGFVDKFNSLPVSRLEDIEKLEQLRVLEHGLPIKVVESKWDSPEVDLPEDIERIENQFSKKWHSAKQ